MLGVAPGEQPVARREAGPAPTCWPLRATRALDTVSRGSRGRVAHDLSLGACAGRERRLEFGRKCLSCLDLLSQARRWGGDRKNTAHEAEAGSAPRRSCQRWAVEHCPNAISIPCTRLAAAAPSLSLTSTHKALSTLLPAFLEGPGPWRPQQACGSAQVGPSGSQALLQPVTTPYSFVAK